jgi:cytidylate kinase
MTEKKIIITLDGWSSCGKSTLAKALARELGYVFVDSGAMYRAITFYFLTKAIDLTDHQQIEKALAQIELSFEFNPTRGASDIILNGENVESKIRELAVASRVSEVAAIPLVRQFAVQQQQRLGKNKGIVMDGRDIGTVVFPEAELKIFMTASKEIRVKRRFQELVQKDAAITIDEVRENLEQRDHMDSNRKESPLRQAKYARVLDNTNLTEQQQFELALGWAKDTIA